MATSSESVVEQLNLHLNSPRRAWLLGAGISFGSGIPLMKGLTDRVRAQLQESDAELFGTIYDSLADGSHIEHVLSQLADLIALAERSKEKNTVVGQKPIAANDLRSFHARLLQLIGNTVRYGYKATDGTGPERVGDLTNPIVTVDDHVDFIRAVFLYSQAGLESQRPFIPFFTTNYDTLLEDALALAKIPYVDGFVGGGTAFWAPDRSYDGTQVRQGVRAHIYKLHGSVDWFFGSDGDIYRCREGCLYPHRDGNLLIYPQSTKYVATQKDPFASLFGRFRKALETAPDNVLIVCGYSFGDEHINGEIQAALSSPRNKTVVLVFTEEKEGALPPVLHGWLSSASWRERLFVATNAGLYHGNPENILPAGETPHGWWTFKGLTDLVRNGASQADDHKG